MAHYPKVHPDTMQIAVINNMVMEDEDAHVLQTIKMLHAFSEQGATTHYYWPDYANHLTELDRSGAVLHPIKCRFRYGAARYLEFLLRILLERVSHGLESHIFTRTGGVALLLQWNTHRVMFEVHQAFKKRMHWAMKLSSARMRLSGISPALVDYLSDFPGGTRRAPLLSPSGVNVKHFMSPTLDIPGPTPPSGSFSVHHLYYGSPLQKGRGSELILAAANALPGHSFTIIGGTSRDVDRLHDEGFALPNVMLLPAIPNAQIPATLKRFDSILLPYGQTLSTARWMSPLKLFEAMAAGVPVIISALPSVTELVPEKYVHYFEPDNAKSFIHSLNAIAADLPAAQAQAKSAQSYCQDHFSWQRRAQDILDYIAES